MINDILKSLAVFILSFSPSIVFSQNLQVVTSVAPISNMVANVGAGLIEVHGIVPEGVNSHTFEPAPSDAKWLRQADLIILNGLDLEIPTIKLAQKVKRTGVNIVQLGDLAIGKHDWKFDFSFPESEGHPNPHLWPNMALAMRYAELARDALVHLDPTNRDKYFANTTAYLRKMSHLDAAIFECVAAIPSQNRRLVTYHDSYAYFAPRYGMQVIGAIQPSDFSQPTPKEVGRIIRQLRQQKVPAVFGSEVFSSKVLQQIAKEANAKFIDELADDDLPYEKNHPEHSFLGMMKNNLMVMSKALGGDVNCMQGIDATNLSGTSF
ncbi:MAG: metal ABC transporter substrate-binding protein [Gammaproteobacteria bacterium]|nr:metal ABC transporter substrate-binding protein [Gammaproteobacteria bacterium]